ncbi:deoxyguanosine kinase, mitochondrial-like isoform X1 [Denticeps clupeoides]|uniref:deoxyguanosine kinase n=1 Tax=Denticeps clupeoides TaxID=299321 RepID=A0AAY4DHH8_9TELE|nr:deoxyguanosine kinase, mitochondrial-like isoform X1 [Denticeps clupeoides]
MAVNGFRKLPSLASAARSVLPTRRPAARAGHTASAEGKVAGTGQLKRVSVEGNIAVGKSTFARLLQDAARGWEVVPEPVSKWQNVVADDAQFDGLGAQSPVSNLLQLMYEDPARWAYTFQTFSCTSRLSTQLRPPPPGRSPPVRVYERSVYSDRYIFALTMFELGFINAAEWAVYQNWHSFLVEQFGPRVQLEGIIYLRAPPEICMKRLHKRGRKEEKDIDLAYLQKLHAQHEKWLKDRKTRVHFEHLKRVPVLVLDAGLAFDRDAEVQRRFIEQSLYIRRMSGAPELEPRPAAECGASWLCSSSPVDRPLLMSAAGNTSSLAQQRAGGTLSSTAEFITKTCPPSRVTRKMRSF